MSDITRYNIYVPRLAGKVMVDVDIDEHPRGEYVLYEDHKRAIDDLNRQLKEAKGESDVLPEQVS